MKTSTVDDLLARAGRLLIAALFLPAGLGKMAHFADITAVIAAKGLPAAAVLAGLTIALEVLASLAVLMGWRVRWAALALAGFTLLAGALFHDFWRAEGPAAMAQQQAFFKNVGIVGGLLLLAALGPGRLARQTGATEGARP